MEDTSVCLPRAKCRGGDVSLQSVLREREKTSAFGEDICVSPARAAFLPRARCTGWRRLLAERPLFFFCLSRARVR